MEYEITLTLKMQTDDNLDSKSIEDDLMREINCASYQYDLESIEVKPPHESAL